MPAWKSACRLWPSVTHGWATQPECETSAAMVRITWGQYVAVCLRLQLTSHTQPTSTLSRIKCERYIFIKKCVRLFIEVRHYVWLYSACIMYMYTYTHNIVYNIFTSLLSTLAIVSPLIFYKEYLNINFASFSNR